MAACGWKRTWPRYLLLTALLCGVGGCGPGDIMVESPPLHIEGKVVDKDGRGVAGETIKISMMRRTSLEDKGQDVATVSTAQDGSYVADFPECLWNHPVAVVGPFTIGAGAAEDLALYVLVGTEEPVEYSLIGHGEKVTVREVVRQADGQVDKKKLDNPDAFVAELERSEELNHMKLVITKQ